MTGPVSGAPLRRKTDRPEAPAEVVPDAPPPRRPNKAKIGAFAAYTLHLGLALVAAWVSRGEDFFETLLRTSGLWAALAVSLSLALSTISRFGALAALRAQRRLVGMLSTLLALVHAGLAFRHFGFDYQALWSLRFVQHGVYALAILALMFATSFGALNHRLGIKDRDGLHQLVHIGVFLIALHMFGSSVLSPWVPVAFLTLMALMYAIRLVSSLGAKQAPSAPSDRS